MTSLEQQKKEIISQASFQQQQAANPKISVWVEASAGTGKTKVLSDRVLRLLLSGVNPARILCLTYTKAAAVEMSSRIAERLSGWAVAEDEKLRDELEKLLGKNFKSAELFAQARRLFAILLDTPGGVKIQTIHSFCQEILKRFPLEAKISPYFEVMDDRTAKDALDTIKKEILRGNVSKEAKSALAFLTTETSEYKFPQIMKSITDECNLFETYLQKHLSVTAMVETAAKLLNIKPDETKTEIKNNFWMNCSQSDINLLITALNCGTDKSKTTAYNLALAIENKDLDKYSKILMTDGRLKKTLLVKQSKELYPHAEKIAKDECDRINLTLKKLTSINLLSSTNAILTLANELLYQYRTFKKIHSKMDYNDLIILTKKLLETPKVAEWVLFKLDGGIDNVLIDEAQDTSPEQWSIIKALTAEFFSGHGAREAQPTVFVVGDRKQSIYSFQGADPQEFENMHQYFSSQTTGFQDINMEVSFRSTAAILDVVNKVFALDKAKEGVARPDQNIKHKPSRIGEGGKVELWPLIEPNDDDNNDKVWLPPVERVIEPSSSAKLAQKIAEMIKYKVSQGELLQSKGRPLKYKDFLILVQRRNSFVEEVVRACKNAGVSITGVDKIKLSEQIVVNDLISVAKFVLLPEDDLNLACLLKSPLFGLHDDDLLVLCYNRGNKSVLQRLSEENNYKNIYETLLKLIDKSKTLRPFEFFSLILNESQGRKKFIARLGVECEDALDEFVNLSLNFEREHIPSLQLFVEWIQKDDVEIKRNLEQKDIDAVRLMTVHGSKGLQAPIVILPDTVRVKNIKQEAGWLKDGDTLLYPLNKEDYEETCCRLKEKEKKASLEEYHRLLYVALTRAEECLCICGYRKKNKPNEESWYNLCKEALGEIAQNQPNDILIYEIKQQFLPTPQYTTPNTDEKEHLPEWIFKNVIEENSLAKPLTPSHQDEDKTSALSPLEQSKDKKLYSRGRLIHKLLQFLPEIEESDRARVVKEFLNKQQNDFTKTDLSKIAQEVLDLINNAEFAPLFSKNSKAEVSLMGQVEDRIISGQIDRLVVLKDKVMIIDYKTNRPPAKRIEDVPIGYIKQMKAYKKLVENIYKDKIIETYILWTNTTHIMKIE